jgi:predicted TIM-barrel enzyme
MLGMIRDVKRALPGLPVILAGYTNHANAARMLAEADGAFVGTCLERDGWGGAIDIERVREYMAIVQTLR